MALIKDYEKHFIKKPNVDENKKKEREEIIDKLAHKPNFHWFIKDKEPYANNSNNDNSSGS